ncbi:MAG TPA: UPF0175 family protein [Oscillatoriaceae cyanobacterium M33_DOE_052]|uniref:Uncharacterized protein n=1 Tax=Planktothricoides sp. SpSt-374 TaxID=2282167 RepID=A0A7C3ZI04_9CYAN|nr:UPF0175 family protein [Oscillatoriaceae cyanobacterium M33_DOE_052]
MLSLPAAEKKTIALYQQKRISGGKARHLAGMNIMEFQRELSQRGITVNYGVEDFQEDLKENFTKLGRTITVVSDTSPITNLAAVGQLDLLR